MNTPFFYPITLKFKVLWIKILDFRNWSIELIAVKMLFPVAGFLQQKSKGQLGIQSLLQMRPGSFGYALGRHMQYHKLDFIPGFEEHDMKHLLLGYDVTVPGEIRLSAFEFGCGNRSFMTLSVFFLGIPMALDLWPQLIRDYRHGKQSQDFRKLPLKKMIDRDFSEMMAITPKNPDLAVLHSRTCL
jgi:hypothetical protein